MKNRLRMIIAILLFMVLLVGCGNIRIKKTSDDFSGNSYEAVLGELKGKGFSNITFQEVEDLTSSGPMKDGTVESVSINGDSSYKANSSFPKDAEVIITYHTIKKLGLPIGSDSIEGMSCTELADAFIKTGFTNVQTKEIYDIDPDVEEKDHIVEIIVNNNEVFEENEKVPYDAEIIINCHLFYEKYTLTLNIDFIPNIIFDRYDVNLTVGDNKVATIEHGEDWQGEISLKSNKYKLSFTSVEDSSVKGTAEIDLDCDIEAKYKISCHSKEIDVEEQYVDRKINLGENQTKVTCTENNYLNKDHQEVYDELKSLGFTNIIEKPVYDIFLGGTTEGTVESVSINGTTEYKQGDLFDKNSEVIIKYHMKFEDDPEYIAKQKKKKEENEEELYSPDGYANEIIIQFNEQNLNTPVSHKMIETWTTGGGEATLVTFEDYCVQFGHVDGYATILLFSDQEKNEENKKAFIEESVNWAKAIFAGTFYDVEQIVDEATESSSIVETELKYHYQKYNIRYEEDEEDNYQNKHTYIIKIYPTLW